MINSDEKNHADFQASLSHAMEHYRAGRTSQAQALFAALTENFPDNYEGWYWLGNCFSRVADHEALVQAARMYSRGRQLKPDDFMLLFQYGCTLQELGEWGQAIEVLENTLKLKPQYARALCTLAICQARTGNKPAAADSFLRAVNIEKDNSLILAQYGYFLEDEGEYAQAAQVLEEAVRKSNYDGAYSAGLGRVLLQLGRVEECNRVVAESFKLNPNHPDLFVTRGLALVALGGEADCLAAADYYDRALVVRPGADDILALKAIALHKAGAMTDALETMERALVICEKRSSHYLNYANILLSAAQAEKAVAAAQRAVELDNSDCRAYSNFLFYLHYTSAAKREDLLRLHRQWSEHYSAGLVINSRDNLVARLDKGREKVRIGFVSGDLRAHAVAFFLLPLLSGLDRGVFEIYCYSNFPSEDNVSRQIKNYSDSWCNISAQNDDAACEKIISDNLNIVIDLSGHTAGSRLSLFLRRLAPVQVSWLGYPDTTGLAEMDYRIVDECVELEGGGDSYSTEELLRLVGGFHCYIPPKDCPEVTALPCARNGYITFGSFNNAAKISPDSVQLWSRVLVAVTGSRLFLKAHGLGDSGVQNDLRTRFEREGVSGERIIFAGKNGSVHEHLARYGDIDICLDTFPYCGTTTTCEALWMGREVVSLVGERHAARMGLSLLSSAGLVGNACSDVEGYVRRCVLLATDTGGLQQGSLSLRDKLKKSRLCDVASFARRYGEKLLYINSKALS